MQYFKCIPKLPCCPLGIFYLFIYFILSLVGDGDLYLFFFQVDIIRFGERSDFLIFGGLSKNFALIVSSIIFSIDDCRSVSNSLFDFIVCLRIPVFVGYWSIYTYISYGRMFQGNLFPNQGLILSLLLYSSQNIDCMQDCI